MRLAYVNLLWVCFTLLGLLFFGIFPATIAVLDTIRKWNIRNEHTISLDFIHTYKREFLKSNLYGWGWTLFTTLLIIGLAHFVVSIQHYFQFIIIGFACILLIISIYFPLLYIHYRLTVKNYIKTAFALTFLYPHFTLLIIVSLLFCYMLFLFIPGLIPFFLVSLPAWMTVSVSLYLFNKLETQARV
ncbi:YesL family protein [Gracilibacillus pellucidus]|uniref:YesL family protein n=1 Tax=Gracilibacillus pellucidus TaxID=3095368 RepID=UPI0039B6EC7C